MIHTFIRALRKRYGLTQEDLASIIRVAPGTIVRTESGKQRPTLDLALRLQVAFGAQPRLVFPEAYNSVEDSVMRSAKARYDALSERDDKRSQTVRTFIEAMPRRGEQEGTNAVPV